MKRRHRTEQKTRTGRTAFREVTVLTMLALTLISTLAPVYAATPTTQEFVESRRFAAACFGEGTDAKTAEVPFSFILGGKSSRELLAGWTLTRGASQPNQACTMPKVARQAIRITLPPPIRCHRAAISPCTPTAGPPRPGHRAEVLRSKPCRCSTWSGISRE